jgi:glutathione S-transferase
MKGLSTDQSVLKFAIDELKKKLAIFDTILGKQAYMGGENFSLIDIFYMPIVRVLYKGGNGDLIETFPNVNAWWQKVSMRESWQKVTQA